MEMREVVAWSAQPKQALLINCPVEDVMFGGARGGGKTDGLLGDFLFFANKWGKYARGILFRRSYPEFEEIERRAAEIYPLTGALPYHASKRMWEWPNGATLKLRFLDKDETADKYIGHSYTWAAFDQAEQWPSPEPIDKIRATLRAGEIKIPKYFRLTANPGGPGHNWLKQRYITGKQPMRVYVDQITKTHRTFIPSFLDDNIQLMKNDPDYWTRVEASVGHNEALLKAWRWGVWDIVAGGMFDDVFMSSIHIMPEWRPRPEDGWFTFRSMDWGSSAPFWVGWFAESPGTVIRVPSWGAHYTPSNSIWNEMVSVYLPKKTLVLFDEWYGCRLEEFGPHESPNVGLKLSSVEVARGIKTREQGFGFYVNPGPADSSIYAVTDKSSNSIAVEMENEGVTWSKAVKGPGSRKNGCELIRTRLRNVVPLNSASRVMEAAGLLVTVNCRGWIRTVPVLPRDKVHVDDVDTDAEDHPCDGTRYALSANAPSIEISEYLM